MAEKKRTIRELGEFPNYFVCRRVAEILLQIFLAVLALAVILLGCAPHLLLGPLTRAIHVTLSAGQRIFPL